MNGVAGALLIVAALACAGEDAAQLDAPAAPTHMQHDTVRLSGDQPRAVVRADPVAAGDAGVLAITIADVANPDGRSIGIDIAIEAAADTTTRVDIGSVALFPVDRGGTFALRLPDAARALLARGRTDGTAVQLVLGLTPDPDADVPDRRALAVTRLDWQNP